jgi:hypothetical protein
MLGALAAMPARADLQAEMNQFFDSLATTTDPTITSTARRPPPIPPSPRPPGAA